MRLSWIDAASFARRGDDPAPGLHTRFTALSGTPAAIVLAALALAILACLRSDPPASPATTSGVAASVDMALYEAVARRVGEGEAYYAAVVAEHRARRFPLRPFVTVRLPILAEIQGRIGPSATPLLLDAVGFLAWLAFTLRLRRDSSQIGWLAGSLALVAGMVVVVVPGASLFHESWAAALVVLSLSCRTRDHWIASVFLGFAACTVRELALPYLCVMAVAALDDGTRRETLAWLSAIACFGILLAGHAAAVARFVTPQDLASPGWAVVGGWPFVSSAVRFSPLLSEAPGWILALVVPFTLLGWIGWRGPLGLRGALLLCGTIAGFMVRGRANNAYWGLMLAPLLLVGLVGAPGALLDLSAACRGRTSPRRRTHQAVV